MSKALKVEKIIFEKKHLKIYFYVILWYSYTSWRVVQLPIMATIHFTSLSNNLLQNYGAFLCAIYWILTSMKMFAHFQCTNVLVK